MVYRNLRTSHQDTGTELCSFLGSPADDSTVEQYVLNSRRRKYWWWTRSRTAHCTVASYSGNQITNSTVHFETSTTFIMDTGSTDHLCKDANLFIGKILPCPKINIKGIGGHLEATGYGTIRFKIMDDHGKQHILTVHNVLYH